MPPPDAFFKLDLTIPMREHAQTGKFNRFSPSHKILMTQFLTKLKTLPADVFVAEYGGVASGRHVGAHGEPVYEFTMAEDKTSIVVGVAYFHQATDALYLRFCDIDVKKKV
ncbi:MAG: hypothetical protein WC091_17910 [Sulfuricellaceae bacterium]